MTDFVQGLPLAETFFSDVVEPLLDELAPDLRFSAGLIGHGSEVFGFDTERSTDHHWGPRLMVFLDSVDLAAHGERLTTELSRRLPVSFRGYPTHFTPPDPNDGGVQLMAETASGPVNHRVEFFVIEDFIRTCLAVDLARPLSHGDWLRLPSQRLRSMVAGKLFRDDLDVQSVRDRFAWYPHDVWLHVMLSVWARIGQEEHLAGRAAEVGDDIGSRLIASRLVRDVMRLAFLLERVYAPYPKWFGTAFARLQGAAELTAPLSAALAATRWREREAALSVAFETLARMHNALGLTAEIEPTVRPFHGRPFMVIDADRFVQALRCRDYRFRAASTPAVGQHRQHQRQHRPPRTPR